MSHHFFVMWSKLLTPTQKRQMAPSLWLSSRQCYLTCRRVWPKANQRRSEKKLSCTTKPSLEVTMWIFKKKKKDYVVFVGGFWGREGKGIVLQKENPRTTSTTAPLNVWRVHCRYIRRYFYDAEWKMIWIIWKNFCIECAYIRGSKNSE